MPVAEEHRVGCQQSYEGSGMARDVDYLKHLLELEYEHSRSAIDKFDDYRARLKGWMITASAGIAAVAFSARTSSIFWAGALMVVLFGLSELLYIDIQEDAIARGRELEGLMDSLSRDAIGTEHEAYRFGLGKVFGGGRLLKLKSVHSWIGYRTFNPFLYGSLLFLMLAAALVAPI
jgi:hypothetical protein